ncbi:MAG: S4 domain-containing protein [Candidatus Absconditabacterales bacterium]
MFLNQYIQKKYNISRRQFTQMINQGQFFLNKEMVNSYKQDIKENDELTFTHQGKKIKDQIKINQKSETSILLFNNQNDMLFPSPIRTTKQFTKFYQTIFKIIIIFEDWIKIVTDCCF